MRSRRATTGPRPRTLTSRSMSSSRRVTPARSRPMPEMRFLIRWPDGTRESCYSPSLIVKDYLVPGQTYPLADFVTRSRAALTIASDRVKEKYGFYCTSAMAQLERIETAAKGFADRPDASITVDGFE